MKNAAPRPGHDVANRDRPIWLGVQPCNTLSLPGLFRMAFDFISSRCHAALFAAAWLIVSGATPSCADEAAPKPAVFSPEKLGRIDDFFNNEVTTGKIPGAMVLIKQHGRQVYFRTFGVSDTDTGRPMTPDTIFPLHSMTKTITSFAAMMLVDQGKLKLD